jgi:hypothetical protein
MRFWARPLAPSPSPLWASLLLPATALGASVNPDTETGVLTIFDDDSGSAIDGRGSSCGAGAAAARHAG